MAFFHGGQTAWLLLQIIKSVTFHYLGSLEHWAFTMEASHIPDVETPRDASLFTLGSHWDRRGVEETLDQ